MKIFQCGNCDKPLYFENIVCDNCGHLTGYNDRNGKMLTFNATNNKLVSDREGINYKFCKNKKYDVCNWVIEENAEEDFCTACQLNRTIPNLKNVNSNNFSKWKNLEIAKHRLIFQLQKIGLPVISKLEDTVNGLCFDFVSNNDNPNLRTGHANGVVTILIKEANSVLREKARKEMAEPYRTLVGHLRHEVGHYYWEVLIRDNPKVLSKFRNIFGDETLDYNNSLQNHYKNGAPVNWQQNFISKYASSHAWEDWAETWAHYLHIMDMVETSYSFGISVNPIIREDALEAKTSIDPYKIEDFNTILQSCIPLSFAVNSFNRSMGIPDAYPFVISLKIIEKLEFVHQLLLPKRKL